MRGLTQIVGIAVALLGMAAAVQASPLPAGPQAAFDKGMAAAKQQDFATAAKHFKEACDLVARDQQAVYPHLYFNRALADSKVPYHELDAIRWFNAYLAAAPNAQNAAQVRAEIAALKTKARQTAKVLAEQAADMLVKRTGVSSAKHLYADSYERAATALAVSVSIEQARQFMKDHQCENNSCSTAAALANADDLKHALLFLGTGIDRRGESDFGICCGASHALFSLKVRAGDLKGAEAFMTGKEYSTQCGAKRDVMYHVFAAWSLSVEYLKAGKQDDVQRMYERWVSAVQQAYPEVRARDLNYDSMARLRYAYGDFEGTKKVASLISDERYEDLYNKGKWTSGEELKEKIAAQFKPEAISEQYRKLAWARYLEADTAAALRFVSLMPTGKDKELAKYAELDVQCQKDPSKCHEIRRASKVARWAETDKKADYFYFGSKELILDIPKVLNVQGKDVVVDKALAEMSVNIAYVLAHIERLEKETGTR
jgi:hypothetical protein